MDDWVKWMSSAVPFVTMFATIVLALLTAVLAWATMRLARASSQPQVTATIQPNLWSMVHCDLIVENSGNAPAYDIVVGIDPEPIQADERGENGIPLKNISVLRPGQSMKSFLSDTESIIDQEFKVEVSWKRHPRDRKADMITYNHRLPKGVSRLGAWSPEIQTAESLKKLREDWQHVARGQQMLKVDGYGSGDRKRERQEIEQLRARREEERTTHKSST